MGTGKREMQALLAPVLELHAGKRATNFSVAWNKCFLYCHANRTCKWARSGPP